MNLSEVIKNLRTQAGLSQEQLGERICVSRQAITKWETGAGVPDISNLIALSRLFGISTDELLQIGNASREPKPFLYESVTRYGLDSSKHLDIKLGSALEVLVEGHDGEDIRIIASSDTIKELDHLLKVKLDDGKGNLDVDVVRNRNLSESVCRESLHIRIILPQKYIDSIEIEGKIGTVFLKDIDVPQLELDGRISTLDMMNVTGTVELTTNSDVQVMAHTFSGNLSINQVNALSKLYLPAGAHVNFIKKGIRTNIILADGIQSSADTDNTIELNGMGCELTVLQL